MLDRLGEIQLAMRARELEGWLIYDFRGQNPFADRALSLRGRTLTRRWFYWLPADGMPVLIVHKTEARGFPGVPGEQLSYASWGDLRNALGSTLPTRGTIAMEYSPMGANPYLTHVDGGTLELVRSYGPTIASSSDLLSLFLGRLQPAQRESQQRAGEKLARVRDQALALVERRIGAGEDLRETELSDLILESIGKEGLSSGGPPVVASGPNSGDPHHLPDEHHDRPLCAGDVLLLDLSAREPADDGVYAELSWVAVLGKPRPEHRRVFDVLVAARDAALELVHKRIETQRRVLGFEVDRAARDVVREAGWAEHFVHRTGHHLGPAMNSGDGATLDDLELHDTRPLLEGLSWSVHPGVYFEEFGMRTTVSVHLGPEGLETLTEPQNELGEILPKSP